MLSQLAIDLFDIEKLNGNDFIGFYAARALYLGRITHGFADDGARNRG